jgi:hypothetical protein
MARRTERGLANLRYVRRKCVMNAGSDEGFRSSARWKRIGKRHTISTDCQKEQLIKKFFQCSPLCRSPKQQSVRLLASAVTDIRFFLLVVVLILSNLFSGSIPRGRCCLMQRACAYVRQMRDAITTFQISLGLSISILGSFVL